MRRLINRLGFADSLSPEDVETLLASVAQRKHVPAGEEIVGLRTPCTTSSILLSGFASRQKVLPMGSRQISGFYVTADFCDLDCYVLKHREHTVVALTDCEVGIVSHDTIDRMLRGSPDLSTLFWAATAADGAISREWLVSIGRRSAAARLAHLFCELFVRLRFVEETKGRTYFLPATQSDLSDAMGMSLVHVNRKCAELKSVGMASLSNRVVTILDWKRLAHFADFDATYLYLGNKQTHTPLT
ncbi:MAG TPA: Crp/Fnr family transcriptional regulator [Pseudolabrys sp.]|nr:Crp/Fnr family transcriptional regulator [Pseudolabrys sp.]